jgi:hypothetical protein
MPYFDHNIPDAAHQFIGGVLGTGASVSVMAFTPSGGWVGVGSAGQYEAQGIPQDCYVALGKFHQPGIDGPFDCFPAGRRLSEDVLPRSMERPGSCRTSGFSRRSGP